MMRVTKWAVVALAIALMGSFGANRAEACCGQLVDIYEFSVVPDILDACAGDAAVISGVIYEYYWAGNLENWPMEVTVTVTDEWGNYINLFSAAVETDYMGESYGVDDDGDGLIDEDPGYPYQGVDDDGDGRVDEDGGYPGDEYADYSFEGAWDCTDDLGAMVPAGIYDLTITASAAGMGSATVYGRAVTMTEEPCCVEGAMVRITPRTINKQRSGRWVTGHVTPPEPYLAGDVIGGRVISIDGNVVDIEGEARGDATLKFPSDDVIGFLPDVPGGPSGHGDPGRVEDVEICVEVDLADGEVLCGACDYVDVIDQ